jgi:mannose-1-phosphate guanylyltransferase
MMKGFLLAAGFGTRLWPLSDVRAKPAFPFRGVPLLVHAASLMLKHGVRDLWVNTHHLPESIEVALAPLRSRDDLTLHVVHETEILGTGGALVNLRDAFAGDSVLVMNGKIVTDIDLSWVMNEASGAVTMVLVPNHQREKFNHVLADERGVFTGVKTDLSDVTNPTIFTGIQVLSPAFFEHVPAPGFSDTIKDIYPLLRAANERITVITSHAHWSEFSTLSRYRDLHEGGFVDPSVTVPASARISRTVVWEGAKIGENVVLEGCLVADGVVLPEGFAAKNAAIIQRHRVKEKKDARVDGDLLVASIV